MNNAHENIIGTILLALATAVFVLAMLGVALGDVSLIPLGLALLAGGLTFRSI